MGPLKSNVVLGSILLIFTLPGLLSIVAADDPLSGDEAKDTTSPGDAHDDVDKDDAAIIAGLFEQVAAQREEVFSATIKYRWHLASYRTAANTPDHVHALFADCDFLGDPGCLQGLVTTLVPSPPMNGPPWEERTFQMLGEKRRCDAVSRQLIQLVDGENEMTYHGVNEQLTIGPRGKSSVHLTDMSDFRCIPPGTRYGLRVEDFRVAGMDSETLTLELIPTPDAPEIHIPSHYEFDRATGILTHYRNYRDGSLHEEIQQLTLTEYPGGIVIPALRIETIYREGFLNTLKIFAIEEAAFNGPVDESLFVMPIDEGTVLVDYRMPEKAVHRMKVGASDVRSILVPVRRPVPPARTENDAGPSWRMLLTVNGLALIVLAAVLWKKASHSTIVTSHDQQGSDRSKGR